MSIVARDEAVATYTSRRRVYLGEDEAAGTLYFPHLFRYAAEGLQLIWSQLGRPAYGTTADGSIPTTARAEADFVAPAMSGETLTQEVRVTTDGPSRLVSEHLFTNEKGTLVARATLVREWMDPVTLHRAELPDWVREAFPARPEAGAAGDDPSNEELAHSAS